MATPRIQTQYLTHRFDGGWATDFGKLVSGFPDQTQEITIPYVLEAQNVFWKLNGGVKKIGGTTQLSSVLASGAKIYGVYDYWKIGTSGSPVQRKICHVGTVVMQDQGSNNFTNLKTGLEAGKHPNYSTFNDLLIFTSDSNTDVPQSWDQTTQQNLAGSPPNFAFSTKHRGRQWASGVAATPSRLHYSAANDPEDWTGAGSGFIDVEPGDGDRITGIASFKNEMWVFKGPNKGSIHRISGASPNDFARTSFIENLPCVSHSTITQFKDDLIFMTPWGSIRSLKATAAFGDYNDAALTFPINGYLAANINNATLYRAWVVNDTTNSKIYATIPLTGSSDNNRVLIYDYQFSSVNKPDRWSYVHSDAWDCQCLARYMNNGLPLIMAGGTDGYVRKINHSAINIDGTGDYASDVQTPFLNYGSSIQEKTLVSVGITLTAANNNDGVEFDWNLVQRDDVAAGTTINFDQGDSANALNEVYADAEEGGQFRWIQYRFRQRQLDEDLDMHAFTAGIQSGAFSTE